MPQIPYEIKQNRIKRLIARQNEITEEISKDYVGNVYEILVEGMQEKKPDTSSGAPKAAGSSAQRATNL